MSKKGELSDFMKRSIELAREREYDHPGDEDTSGEINQLERSVSVELYESEACFLIELIELKIKAHKSYADQAIKKGYGTTASQVKRDEHLAKAEELGKLIDKLRENLV